MDFPTFLNTYAPELVDKETAMNAYWGYLSDSLALGQYAGVTASRGQGVTTTAKLFSIYAASQGYGVYVRHGNTILGAAHYVEDVRKLALLLDFTEHTAYRIQPITDLCRYKSNKIACAVTDSDLPNGYSMLEIIPLYTEGP